jgi:hypothetical protein
MINRVAIAVLLVPSSVLAQNSRDCRHDHLNHISCTTQVQLLADGYGIPNYAEQLRAAQAAFEATEQTKRAAQMVAGGDCAGAERYALRAENLPLAQQVRDYCHR